MIMAQHFIIFVLIHLSFCWKPGYAQLWAECEDYDALPREFYACKCRYSHSGEKVNGLGCVDTGYTDPTVISRIPFEGLVDTLSNLTMTGNNFRELPINLFGSCSPKDGQTMKHSYLGLDYLDLSNNNINLIHGKTFHCIQNLRTLKLDDNNLDHPENSPRMFSDLEALEVLHLKNAFNFDRQGTADEIMVRLSTILEGSEMDMLTELHLESNYIGSFSPKLFEKLRDLEKLYVSDNYLTNPVLSPNCGGYIEGCRLQEVYLNSNSITRLSPEFMQNIDKLQRMEKLDVSDNPFWCDCNFKDTYSWLKSNQIILVNSHRLLCNGPPKVAGKAVLSLNASDLEECRSEADFAAKAAGKRSAGNVILTILLVAIFCIF